MNAHIVLLLEFSSCFCQLPLKFLLLPFLFSLALSEKLSLFRCLKLDRICTQKRQVEYIEISSEETEGTQIVASAR